MKYLAHLTAGRIVLWCYFIWYLFFVACYFDPRRQLWLTSLGISAIIGVALVISTAGSGARLTFWPTFRLFLMPFCVSSFSALVKDRGFFLVFSANRAENLVAALLCIGFCAFVGMAKFTRPRQAASPEAVSPAAPQPPDAPSI